MKVVAVLGVGPGLGLSIARRFGREGLAVALVSRSTTRHPEYQASLKEDGVEARTYVADVRDPIALRKVLAQITADLGPVDTAYFGPLSMDDADGLKPIGEVRPDEVQKTFDTLVHPVIEVVNAVLPEMLQRGTGTILIPGGLSGKYPIPMLGKLAPASAALRMYVLTLNETLKDTGVYAGALTIGGMIRGGDIHAAVSAQFAELGAEPPADLDPTQIADAAWSMSVNRKPAESEFGTF
ncbi:SDR family NAD(P)-dependent oxidoreductase [Kribbella sp. NPDC051718]|uniref:SDR family oxidoreductase n=1 Tax=Kribbella sp. NPDC051718 TaxID=3155168 RepID=UPI00342AB0DC